MQLERTDMALSHAWMVSDRTFVFLMQQLGRIVAKHIGCSAQALDVSAVEWDDGRVEIMVAPRTLESSHAG